MGKKKVIVTGADGVLGSNLVRELLARDYNVSVLLLEGTTSKTLDGLSIQKYFGNILNLEDLNNAFIDKDIVIHCAASTSVYPARDSFVNKVNIEGTKNVISAVKSNKIERLVYVGTANSFGNGTSLDAPGDENNDYTAHVYGLDYMDSKRKAQEILLECVRNEGIPAIVVNPTFMIGPFDSKPSSGAMVLAIYNGKVPGYTNGGKNYIAVKDAAIAVANAITMGKIGECYILGNENLSYKDAFEKIANAVGGKAPKRKMSDVIVKAYGRINSFLARVFKFKPSVTKELAIISCDRHYYSAEKARQELGLPSTPMETAFKECFEWFKQNGYLKEN